MLSWLEEGCFVSLSVFCADLNLRMCSTCSLNVHIQRGRASAAETKHKEYSQCTKKAEWILRQLTGTVLKAQVRRVVFNPTKQIGQERNRRYFQNNYSLEKIQGGSDLLNSCERSNTTLITEFFHSRNIGDPQTLKICLDTRLRFVDKL